jgi:predicted phage-related endonuclease
LILLVLTVEASHAILLVSKRLVALVLTGETAMSQASLKSVNNLERRYFIGGSDARVIMGHDEAALLRLWREKRGAAAPEDLSANLIVQLGVVTEPLGQPKAGLVCE